MARRTIKKTMIYHVFEYEYFVEKVGVVAIALSIIALLIVLAGWVEALNYYAKYAVLLSLRIIGLPLAVTMTVLMALWAAFMIPHFEPGLRPRRFRIIRDKRLLHIYLSLIVILLSLATLITLLISITGSYTISPFT